MLVNSPSQPVKAWSRHVVGMIKSCVSFGHSVEHVVEEHVVVEHVVREHVVDERVVLDEGLVLMRPMLIVVLSCNA